MSPADEDDLRRQLAQWEQFADLLVHDLRAPMRAVDNLAQWIEESLGPRPAAELGADLALLRRRVRRMASLLEDLRVYARIGKVREAAVELDLGELARKALAELPPRPGIEARIAEGLPRVKAPPTDLGLALRCLLSNALKHHDKERGWVAVEGALRKGLVEITVSDNGPGIEAGQHERIFLPCQTLRPKDEVEGNGMGLAIVKRLAETHGAELTLGSSPGSGSRFTLLWPQGI